MFERPWHRHYENIVSAEIRYPRIPVHEILNVPAKTHPDKTALNFYGTETSYWELRLQVLRMANALRALGVKKGDRVGLHLPNCPQYVISYYAVLSLGGIVVNINPLYTADELTLIARTTSPAALVTFDMVLPVVRQVCQAVEISRVIVTRVTDFIKGFEKSTAKGMELDKGWRHFSEILDGAAAKRIKVEVAPEDPAMIQFTGGTTGVPKGAVLTHGNVLAATMQCSAWGASIMQLLPVERRTTLSVIPYFHVYGNILCMNLGILNCGTQILVPRFQPDELMGIIGNFSEISFFPAVPTLINAVINHPKAPELGLDRRLGLFNSGAAPMPVELIEQVKDMGLYFTEGWGMSETTSVGIFNPIMGLKKTGSIGIPIPDMDVRLVDVDTGKEDVPDGTPGEILIRGPVVMKEYWNNPAETAGQLRDGWLSTGDIAVRDGDGYIFIVDRKKDMIIAGGYNIYPRDVDEVLFTHPKVLDAVTIGVPDEYRGETVKSFVVLKPGQTATAEEIVAFCKTKLAAYKVPKLVEFRDALPKSAVGKVLRKILRAEEEAKKKK